MVMWNSINSYYPSPGIFRDFKIYAHFTKKKRVLDSQELKRSLLRKKPLFEPGKTLSCFTKNLYHKCTYYNGLSDNPGEVFTR